MIEQNAVSPAHGYAPGEAAFLFATVRSTRDFRRRLADTTKADPKGSEQVEAVAKKNGFAGYDEYNAVVDNISVVLGGFDPATKKYVGPETVIKAQIAQVQADKKMPAKDKKAALADLNAALKTPPPPIENKGNIDLVTQYYDKLADALCDDER